MLATSILQRRERKRKRLKDKSGGEGGLLLRRRPAVGGPRCCSYVYKLVSDTLTVRKTPSEEDAGGGDEGEIPRGRRKVRWGIFREVIRPCREGETSQQSERWRRREGARGEEMRRGPFARSLPRLRCHGSRSEKEGSRQLARLSIYHVDAKNLISIIVTVTVAAPHSPAAPSLPNAKCRKADVLLMWECSVTAPAVSPNVCKSRHPPPALLVRDPVDVDIYATYFVHAGHFRV